MARPILPALYPPANASIFTPAACTASCPPEGRRGALVYNLPRAVCFDDEIMRTFQKLGLAGEIGRGAVVQRDHDWLNAEGETLVELICADSAPSGWAQLYMMFQPHVEDVLDRHDKALPEVAVRQGATVTGLLQDEGA